MTEQDKPFEVTPEFLDNVRFENIRNNQVGGMTDGITPERAEDDLGFESDEQFSQIRQEVRHRVRPTAVNRGLQVGDAELDAGRTPDYHRPVEENLPTDEQIETAKRHLPAIREILRQAQSEQPEQEDDTDS